MAARWPGPSSGREDAPHDEANHAPNESMTLEGFVNGIRTTAAAFFELAAT